MESADWSMSSSVVDQFETEIRMAVMSCQRVWPSQHTRSSWTSFSASSVALVAVASCERDPRQHLIEDDVVQDFNRWLVTQAIREPLRQPAAAGHEVVNPRRPSDFSAAYTAKPRARREDSGVQSIGSRGSRGERTRYSAIMAHRGAVCRWMGGEDEPRVVGHVQPFVGIGRPRIGSGDACGEMARGLACTGPESKGAVHVQPSAALSDQIRRSARSGSNAPVFTLPA